MTSRNSQITPRRPLGTGSVMLHAAAFALAVTMAIPAIAADSRPVKSRVAPVYPEIAKRLRIEGAVKIDATVDPSGKVIERQNHQRQSLALPRSRGCGSQMAVCACPGPVHGHR